MHHILGLNIDTVYPESYFLRGCVFFIVVLLHLIPFPHLYVISSSFSLLKWARVLQCRRPPGPFWLSREWNKGRVSLELILVPLLFFPPSSFLHSVVDIMQYMLGKMKLDCHILAPFEHPFSEVEDWIPGVYISIFSLTSCQNLLLYLWKTPGGF